MITFDKKAFKGSVFLFFAALIWGSAFVAQKICEDYPFATNALRFLFSAVFMIPILFVSKRIALSKGTSPERTGTDTKTCVKRASLCGFVLAFATTFQQLGMAFGTSAGKAGFLTALYMVLIPVFGLFLHKKAGLNVWLAVCLAFIGVFLMSIKNDYSIEKGDLILILCAVFFAVQVLMVDNFIEGCDSLFFSFVQLLTAGITCSIALIVVNLTKYEVLNSEAFRFILLPVLYIAIFSCCIAYTFQVVGQKSCPPAAASVIMSLESVFSLVFSLLFGGVLGRVFGVDLSEQMSLKIGIGIALVFIAVMLSQFNPFSKKKQKE